MEVLKTYSNTIFAPWIQPSTQIGGLAINVQSGSVEISGKMNSANAKDTVRTLIDYLDMLTISQTCRTIRFQLTDINKEAKLLLRKVIKILNHLYYKCIRVDVDWMIPVNRSKVLDAGLELIKESEFDFRLIYVK